MDEIGSDPFGDALALKRIGDVALEFAVGDVTEIPASAGVIANARNKIQLSARRTLVVSANSLSKGEA
jgi:hypothetical protein